MFHGILILLAAIAGWVLLLAFLERRGLLERFGMALMGPFLMMKTLRGRGIIERISKWRGVHLAGHAFVYLVIITMIGMTFLLAWTATLVTAIPADQAPSPQTLLGLPGINPFIPLTYGIFALAVSIIVHEFSHGILARRWNVKIKSLGLLLFIVPIGAFVEPEEEEMKALDRRKRGTVYAAGPGSNMVLAIVMALLFSLGMMGSVQARAVGMGVTGIVEGSPAMEANLAPGMIITAVDGSPVPDGFAFQEVLADLEAGEQVTLTVFSQGTIEDRPLTLADRYDFTSMPTEEDRGKGFIGVTTVSTSPDIFNPLESSKSVGWLSALFIYILMPFQGLSPIQSPLTEFYEVTGIWSILPADIFWVLANAVYWLFWINLMLGMTNALPAVPLDGGYLMRDWLDSAIRKLKGSLGPEARERAARNVSYFIALIILGLILWQLIGPRL